MSSRPPAPDSTVTVARAGDGAERERVAPFLFLAIEASRPCAMTARYSLEGVDAVVVGRGGARGVERTMDGGRCVLTVRVPDPSMSQTHARLERGLGQWTAEDAGSKNGTLLNGEPLQRGRLDDGDLLTFGYSIFLFRAALPLFRDEVSLDAATLTPVAPGMMTLLPELERDLSRLAQVAPSGVTVMIRGETGTGKEVLARAVHALSKRSGDFVAINCGALTDTLVESELFGHRKGAFSGAVEDYVGLVRSAHGGTLLLDEIGDLPPASQAAFLRVLQEREVMPVGATRAVPVDLRIISATHRDLEDLVAQGKFRSDLLARVSGFRIDLPPVRERREDIGLLAAHLLRRLAGASAGDVVFTESAARALLRYDWPHNVRELETVLGAALVLAAGPPQISGEGFAGMTNPDGRPRPIDLSHLGEPLRAIPATGDGGEDGEELRARLLALLTEHGGNISAVARAMGKARMQIHRWMRRFGIEPAEFRHL